MSDFSLDQELNHCACCPSNVPDPSRHNRPGQSALAYRIGTHSAFLGRMMGRLHTQEIPDGPNAETTPLEGLAGRSAQDDPALALLDAAAMVTDVLSFYQERIANEGFLGTATERRSVLEIARSIGYELVPGVSAGTFLAFTVADAPAMPNEAKVPQGTAVQSIPPQGKLPQTFETSEEITASVSLNAFLPRLTKPQEIARGTNELYLNGVTTQLQVGDAILLVGAERESSATSEQWDLRILTSVTTNQGGDFTVVGWEPGLGHESPSTLPAEDPKAYALRQRASLFGFNAPDWRAMPLTVRAGYDSSVDPDDLATGGVEWPDFWIRTLDPPRVDLDADYPKLLKGSWVALGKPGYIELYLADEVTTHSRTDFTLTGKSTRLDLDTALHLSWFGLRDTLVYTQSEEIERAEQPITTPVFGDVISLDSVIDGLEEGKALSFSGKPAGLAEVADLGLVVRVAHGEETRPADVLELVSEDGSEQVTLAAGDLLEVQGPPTADEGDDLVWNFTTKTGFNGYLTLERDSPVLIWHKADEGTDAAGEVALIKDVSDDGDRTTVTLQNELAAIFDRASLTINGNVVKATLGETVNDEVLGNGIGAETNQTFQLRIDPLTYISASTASGSETTLKVRVNDVLWEEVASLFGSDAQDKSYITRLADDGTVSVIFGDGISGARLPSGSENVKATYRHGVSLNGEVDANTLTLLKNRPQGIQKVDHPTAAAGAAAPEVIEDARVNAPRTVLTLDRIVSLRDFEDFARAFAGIGKAQATDLWLGETHLVYLTVASNSGQPIEKKSDLYENLVEAIERCYDPRHTFKVHDYEGLEFNLAARVAVDPAYVAEDVLAEVESTITSEFAFENRSLGQPVSTAQVITVIHSVDGVVAVDVDQLYLSSDLLGPDQVRPPAFLPAVRGRLDAGTDQLSPSQLIVINTEGISLSAMEEV